LRELEIAQFIFEPIGEKVAKNWEDKKEKKPVKVSTFIKFLIVNKFDVGNIGDFNQRSA
jgi:hypothetical protein